MFRNLVRKIKYNSNLSVLYIADFFFSLHLSFVLYINSSFIAKHTNEDLVGIFYTISAFISILLLFILPKFLKNFGNYRTIMLLSELEMFALFGMGLISITPVVILLFMTQLIVTPLIFFNLDIFIQKSTKKKRNTGSIRGIFLTISSFAFILTPTIVGNIIEKSSFQNIYLISAFILIPFIALISFTFKKFVDPPYKIAPSASIPFSLKRLVKDKNIGRIFMARIAFRVFTVWTLIYIPMYLSSHLNFLWSDIGAILTIMLLPYIILEYPLGILADKKIGEKEMLITGIFLMIMASVSFSIFTIPNFFFWAFLLFIGRTGATASEIATESYFFKHVQDEDTEIISLFRMSRPLSYIISTIGALIALSFMEFQFMFIVLASLIAFFGLPFAFKIEDTK